MVAICATQVFAQPGAFDKDERNCRREIAEDLGVMVRSINKAFVRCRRDQQKAKIPAGVNCNDLSDPGVDPRTKPSLAVLVSPTACSGSRT